jgi:hypothetical protein
LPVSSAYSRSGSGANGAALPANARSHSIRESAVKTAPRVRIGPISSSATRIASASRENEALDHGMTCFAAV